MTTSTRWMVGLLLGAVALSLLGYAAYLARERIQALEEEAAMLQASLAEIHAQEGAFFAKLNSPEFADALTAIVDADTTTERGQEAVRAKDMFIGLQADVPEGYELFTRLTDMVDTQNPERRSILREELEEFFCIGCGDLVAEPYVEQSLAEAISAWVPIAGALGTGLMSMLAFITGGARRRLEQAMLELDLEMKRIEVAKARLAAREALAEIPTV